MLKHQFFQHSWPQQEENKQMELIHAKMRKAASLHGGICFIKEVAWEAKFIPNFQNIGNEVKNFNYGEESWIFNFFSIWTIIDQKRDLQTCFMLTRKKKIEL